VRGNGLPNKTNLGFSCQLRDQVIGKKDPAEILFALWQNPSVKMGRQPGRFARSGDLHTRRFRKALLGAACHAGAPTSRHMPLLTELEKGSVGRRFYKHGAPNGAFADGGDWEIIGPRRPVRASKPGRHRAQPKPGADNDEFFALDHGLQAYARAWDRVVTACQRAFPGPSWPKTGRFLSSDASVHPQILRRGVFDAAIHVCECSSAA